MRVRILGLGILVVAALSSPAIAQRGGSHGSGGSSSGSSSGSGASSHGGRGTTLGLGAVSGGWAFYPFPFYMIAGPDGVFTFLPPFFSMGPGGFAPMIGPVAGPPGLRGGPVAPPPPPGWFIPVGAGRQQNPPVHKDPARAAQLVSMGDRLFRGSNLKKAEERYRQAARLDHSSAAPRVRLAQVALSREQYSEAAMRLREAETAQPGWIATAADIQA